MSHPYRGLPDYQFWPRAVTWVAPGSIDPVVEARFRVGPEDRIATMGSCFAQHLSRHLARSGLGYYVAETAPDGCTPEESERLGYGVFSARYGNVYTVAQAVQLFRRAYGDFQPDEHTWDRGDRVVDPFRPQVEPEGFAGTGALETDRARHLAATRDVFERADVLVFTLGLTEAWRSRGDGAVFPTAPGVAGGTFDPDRHEFVNFDIDEVRADLFTLCDLVRSVNPSVRILLTVSPVPLVATYESRHVLVSTTYSKSVLRVAAAAAVERHDFVDYFPSYEMISSASSPRNYFASDLREVEPIGVAHVMRSFTRHYVEGQSWQSGSIGTAATAGGPTDVVCDEDAIRAAVDADASDATSAGDAVDRLAWGPAANGAGENAWREQRAATSEPANGRRAAGRFRRLTGLGRRGVRAE